MKYRITHLDDLGIWRQISSQINDTQSVISKLKEFGFAAKREPIPEELDLYFVHQKKLMLTLIDNGGGKWCIFSV